MKEAPETAGRTLTAASPDRSAPPSAPPRVPDHELIRRIGRGAYGEVWLARGATGGRHGCPWTGFWANGTSRKTMPPDDGNWSRRYNREENWN